MRRFGPLVVVAILGLVVSLAIIAFVRPSWEFQRLPVGTAGESIQSIAWSPDGSRFLTQENGRYTIMRASDGAVLLAVDGYSPVWIDARTIESLREIGAMRTELVRLDLGADYPSPLGAPLGVARLIADRDGHLAARSELGDVVTKVLDPTDGGVIATLPGLRGQVWAGSGTLVSKTVDPRTPGRGSAARVPRRLVGWAWIVADRRRPGRVPRQHDRLTIRQLDRVRVWFDRGRTRRRPLAWRSRSFRSTARLRRR